MEQKKSFAPEQAIELSFHLLHSLDAAHKSGRVYGALYPDQIRFQDDGKVQILDLAAPRDPEDVTLTYLAFVPPELLESDPSSRPKATSEADLYSVGIVLYVLLTGRTPFPGEDREKVVESIFQVRIDALPEYPGNLNQLNWIIRKCLLRVPTRRFRSVDDMQKELRDIRPHHDAHKPAIATTFPRAGTAKKKAEFDPKEMWERHWKIIVPAAGAVVLLLIVVILVAGRKGPARSIVSGTAKPLPSEWSFETAPTLSPAADQVAYISDLSGNDELYMRSLKETRGIALTRSPGKEEDPRWSPAGDSILYTYREPRQSPTLFAVSTSGGIPQKIVGQAEQGQWSPDGKRVCFIFVSQNGQRNLAIVDTDSFEVKIVVENEKGLANPTFSGDGTEIVYEADLEQGHGLVRVELNSGKKKVLTTGPSESMPCWDWKADAVYYCSLAGENSEIWVMDHEGDKEKITSGGNDLRPDVAQGKGSVSFYGLKRLNDIFSLDVQKKVSRNVSPVPGASSFPLSVGGGRWLAFLEEGDNGFLLNWTSLSTSTTSNLLKSVPAGSNFAVSPDGSTLYWEDPSAGLQQLDLTTGKSSGAGESMLLPYDVSPDRKSLFYARKETQEAVYLLKNLKDQQEETLFRLPLTGRIVKANWTPQGKSIVMLTTDHRLSLFSLADKQTSVLSQSCFDFSLKPKTATAAVLTGPDAKHTQLILLDVAKSKQTTLTSFGPEGYATHINWSQEGEVIYYDRTKPGAELLLIE